MNVKRKEFLLPELKIIHESGPMIGEDEARREFFILEELKRTPERKFAESFVELLFSMPDDGYRE